MSQDIVLISGQQGSGKSSSARAILEESKRMEYDFASTLKFADPLYELHNKILNKMELFTDKKRVEKDGLLLQILGTEWARKTFGENVWSDILKNKVSKLNHLFIKRLTVIDDCRFENEFLAFPQALRVRLVCDEETRRNRADAWRENTIHPSETGLDIYAAAGMFDLYVDTSKDSSPEHVATLVLAQLAKKSWMEKR